MTNSKPKYSICMCNYNMSDTIERSLRSLLEQLDERYEVVLVDDGSSDNSVSVVEKLMREYENLRIVELDRDPERKLGSTRNIAVKEAVGDFVILHLDCDDVFGPHIDDFVQVFHRIERAVGHDILLSGQHINIGNREFLLSHGPYLNLYRGEDRNLWSRLGKINAWIPIEHVDFITRLPKKTKTKFVKNIVDTFDHMKNDFRSGLGLLEYFNYEMGGRANFSRKLFIFRLAMLVPSWFMSIFDSRIPTEGTLGGPKEFADYRDKMKGTYYDIMNRLGKDTSMSFLKNSEAKKIFSNNS
ncbi:glycosyltransferase [Vibrio europaeus]|uniref:glycosyltransferase family 2 protein n=1 Tax=Vibrio europaeus TaxID=300876 RepID=UPI002341C21E|nr:glycosyltransferase family 2 protein [Vibrio europaeus]MDC5850454.1 glycosyltransferase [Vibrio europaeus]